MAFTVEQVDKVASTFDAFAKDNLKYRTLRSEVTDGMTSSEIDKLNEYMLAVREGRADRGSFPSSKFATQPEYKPLIEAAKKSNAAEKAFVDARDAMEGGAENTQSIVEQVKTRSDAGKPTTKRDVKIPDVNGDEKSFEVILANQRKQAGATPAPGPDAGEDKAELRDAAIAYKVAENRLFKAVAPQASKFKLSPQETDELNMAKSAYLEARRKSLAASGAPKEDKDQEEYVLKWEINKGIDAARVALGLPTAPAPAPATGDKIKLTIKGADAKVAAWQEAINAYEAKHGGGKIAVDGAWQKETQTAYDKLRKELKLAPESDADAVINALRKEGIRLAPDHFVAPGSTPAGARPVSQPGK